MFQRMQLKFMPQEEIFHIEGIDRVAVYGINGSKIYNGTENEIHVTPGVYIVRTPSGKSYKVVVI